MSSATIKAFDLTKRPPRSPRSKLGGYVILPRLLDKGRALLAGSIGEYSYACPLDGRFHEFAGTSPDEILELLKQGKGDGEVLLWIQNNGKNQRTDFEIEAWSKFHEKRSPGNLEYRRHFTETHEKLAPHRTDISTSFDLLDLDDYASFGGAV